MRESRSSPRLTEDPTNPRPRKENLGSMEFEQTARDRLENILAPEKNIQKKIKNFENKMTSSGKLDKLENLLKECTADGEGKEGLKSFERKGSIDLRKLKDIGKLQRLETPRYDPPNDGIKVPNTESPMPLIIENKILNLDESLVLVGLYLELNWNF